MKITEEMKTTREAAKEDKHKQITNNLQELLEKNYDAEKGFKKAVMEAQNPRLKEFFKEQAKIHSYFATQLHSEIHKLNEKPRERGSTIGNIHRMWMDIRELC